MQKKLGNKIFKNCFQRYSFFKSKKREKEESWKVSKFLKCDSQTTNFVVTLSGKGKIFPEFQLKLLVYIKSKYKVSEYFIIIFISFFFVLKT